MIQTTIEPSELHQTTRKTISPRTRYKLLRRDGFRCQYCGKTAEQTELEIDHIIPISKGGSDGYENLITACIDCNQGKSAESIILPKNKTIFSKNNRQKTQLYNINDCPKCNCKKTRKYGYGVISGGKKTQRRQCTDCGYVYFTIRK